MTLIRLVLAIMLAAGLPGAGLTETAQKPAETAQTLDLLFDDLKAADSQSDAFAIERRIWAAWMQSGSPTVDLLVSRAGEALQAKDYGLSMQLLDTVVELEPEYAEGWNRRATLHYVMKNYRESLGDIQRTLALEPRHFGALSGLGSILLTLDNKEAAFDIYKRALAIHPFLRGAREAVEAMREDVEGRGI